MSETYLALTVAHSLYQGIPYNRMCFFDDDPSNIRDVSRCIFLCFASFMERLIGDLGSVARRTEILLLQHILVALVSIAF
jgi:hypothetical protein